MGLVTFIKAYYSDSTFTESVISTPMNQMNSIWTPPGINEVKCNFDATFNKCMFSSVFRIIFRYSEGHILATCAYPNSFVADATTVEAKTCLQAVTVAEELGFRRLVVEGDSLIVIKKIRSSENNRSSISMIIKEIKKRAQGYESFTRHFVGRAVNRAAHTIAKEGNQWPSAMIWVKEAPSRVEAVAEEDRRALF